MKITKQNSVRAEGYADENIRMCMQCNGDGLYMRSQHGGIAIETECVLCGGSGLVTFSTQE